MAPPTQVAEASPGMESASSDLDAARRVIGQAKTGLDVLAAELGEPFIQCIDVIAALDGRGDRLGHGKERSHWR